MRASLTITAAAVALLTGCSTSSHVLVGTQRPAISPIDVKLYTHPPDKYEEVAILDASSKGSAPGEQSRTNKVVKRLKEEAAALGANGVLLEGFGERTVGSVGQGFGSATAYGNTAYGSGFGVTAGIRHKTGKGMAIYVPPPAAQ